MTEILSLKYGLYKKIGKEAGERIAALPSRYIFPSDILCSFTLSLSAAVQDLISRKIIVDTDKSGKIPSPGYPASSEPLLPHPPCRYICSAGKKSGYKNS